MECSFLGLNKLKCIYQLKCEGISQLILDLGGDTNFATNFSRYTWFRSFLNKISDKSKDPVLGLIGNTIKILSKIFTPILRFFIKDVYGIDKLISKIESDVENLENSEFILDPLEYFNKVGEGYAIIFRYAAVGAHTDIKTMKRMENLGQTLGALISFRDSVQDLKRDRITGSFNPFKTWKDENVLLYYQDNSKKLIENINNLIENISLKVNIKNEAIVSNHSYILSQSQALGSLTKYASIATTPFLGCKTKLNAQSLPINCDDACPGAPGQGTVIISLIVVLTICCCLISCCCAQTSRRSPSASTCRGCDCGGCDCGASDCSDCGCGDCGDCGDCGGCDAGGCDCSC